MKPMIDADAPTKPTTATVRRARRTPMRVASFGMIWALMSEPMPPSSSGREASSAPNLTLVWRA